MKNIKIFNALVLLSIIGVNANAQTNNEDIKISAKITSGCLIEADDIHFGALEYTQIKQASEMLVQPGGVTYGYEKASEIRTRCSKNASYTLIGAPMINFTNSLNGSTTTGQKLVGTNGGNIKWAPYIAEGSLRNFWFSDGKTYNGVSTSRTIPLTGTGVTQVIKLSNIIYASSKKELRFIPDSYQNSYTMTVSF